MEHEKLIKMMQARTYDLAIVTSRLDEKINGQTVGWLTQVSINPTRVAIGLSIDTLTNLFIKQSTIFAINFIPKNRQDLIELFGYRSGKNINKFQDVDYFEGKTGSPILKDAAAYLDCQEVHIYNLDGYDLIIGEAIDADCTNFDWFTNKDLKRNKRKAA